MKILAIETATEACSAAVYNDGEITARFEFAPREHTQLILPMLDDVLEDAGVTREELDAIAFGAYDTALGPALEAHGGARFHLAGRLDINDWRGRRSVQLRLEDAAAA